MKTMKSLIQTTFILLIVNCFFINTANAQIAINSDGSISDASAMLDVSSTSKGILIPRMTTAERTAIASPSTSLLVYDTDEGTYWYYENNQWNEIATQADFSNVTATQEPSHISTTAIGDQPIEMVEDNSYLYILERNDDQVRVININNPTTPTTATTFVLPNNAYLTDIAIAGNYAYVTSSNPNEPQLWIFDISTPSNIDTIGSFDVGGRFSSIDISDNYAYVTDFTNEKLRVLDISTPSAPSQVAEVNNIYNGLNTTIPKHEVLIEDNYAYVFHNASSSSGQISLSVVDMSTPTSPSVVSTTALSGGLDEIYSFIKHGNHLYYDSNGSSSVNVIDVSDPTTPSSSVFSSSGAGISIYTLALQGDYLFLNGGITDYIDVKDLSTSATSPSSIYTTSTNNITSGGSTEMLAIGSFLYTITDADELLVHQIAPTYTQGVTADGSTAFYEIDNSLGDHTASENIQLNGNWLSNDGDDEGISIDDDGNTTLSGQLTIGSAFGFPTVDGTTNQVLATDGSGTLNWTTLDFDNLSDADGDTKIQLEESSNEDIIRFDLGGTEFMRLDSGRIEILNTGGSVFIGEGAGTNDDYDDNRNVFIGYESGLSNISGNNNTFQGYQSGYSNISGDYNIFNGSISGYNNTTGHNNIFQGRQSGYNNTTGSYNTYLGYQSGLFNIVGDKNIFLGYQAGFFETGSNKLYIDNSNTSTPLIYGDFDRDSLDINGILSINGTLNINNVYEFPIVDGTANQILATDGNGSLTWSDLNNGFLSENGVTTSVNNSDDLVFGADTLNYSGSGSDEHKMFFDQSLAAFRVGRIQDTNWDETNLGAYSFAAGTNTIASGKNAAAFGSQTIASSTYAFSGGNQSEATGKISFAFGRQVIAPSYSEIAMGLFNTTYTPNDSAAYDAADRLFVIGNGTSNNSRSDAMVVYKNGNTTLNGALTINDEFTFPTIDGAANQTLMTDGNGTLSWETFNLLSDADGDTKILVEESSDEDTIKFYTGGTEYFKMNEGRLSVMNTGGSIFLGENAGASDDLSDNFNIAIGYNALKSNSNTYGTKNIAIGAYAAEAHTISTNNIFIGNEVAKILTSSTGNVFLGNNVGKSLQTASNNTSLGYDAFDAADDASENVIIGSGSGGSLNQGDNNVMIGYNAGNNLTTGNGNIFIGYSAGGTDYTFNNQLYIDNSSSNSPLIWGDFSSNKIVINGNSSHNSNNRTLFVNGNIGATSAFNNDSDRRLKKDIQTIPSALDKVLQMRGVTYQWKDGREEGDRMGFIAQEVEPILPQVVDNKNDHYTMQYAPITAVLIEAVKEQQQIIEAQQNEINQLKALQKEVLDLKKNLEALLQNQ